MFNVDTMYLDDVHTVDVKVEYAENHYVSGILKINTKKITLDIFSDRTDTSKHNYERNIKKLECTNYLNATFILHNAKLVYLHNAELGNGVSSFFNKYEIEEILYYKYPISNNIKYYQLSFKSDDISKWIGNTILQQEIIKAYHNHSTSTIDTKEFLIDLGGMYLTLHYPITRYDNSPKQKAGINFKPVINIVMQKETSFQELKQHFNDLLNLFYLLIGYDIDISKVIFHSDNNEDISYYYIKNLDRNSDRLIFINLGHNLRFPNVDKLPLDVFKNYFSLSSYQKRLFSYHKKYKLFNAGEESFLGFFRILENTIFDDEVLTDTQAEKLTLEEGRNDLKGHHIKKCKGKKLNSQDCISYIKLLMFYDALDNELKDKIKITKEDIREIIKLRNNITHFNEYNISDKQIKEYAIYLEFLSTYSLLKLLDYPKQHFSNNIIFYANYHLIMKENNNIVN